MTPRSDCENPDHRRAAHMAVNAELTAWELRGLASLLTAWGAYLASTDPGSRGHDEVTMFLTRALDGMAERLEEAPDEPEQAPGPEAPALTVVRPVTPA